MTEEELIGKLEMIQRMKSESNILELKVQKKDAHSICMILCPVFQIRMRAESLFSELMKSRIIKK